MEGTFPRLQLRAQIQWSTLGGRSGLNWASCHPRQPIFKCATEWVKLMIYHCMWRSMCQTLIWEVMNCLLWSTLFSFVTSSGYMSWVSWHHSISKQSPHGSTQIIKVNSFNSESLSIRELNASKNQNSFCLIKVFKISGLPLRQLYLIPDFKNACNKVP